jgi:hypothetical protein
MRRRIVGACVVMCLSLLVAIAASAQAGQPAAQEKHWKTYTYDTDGFAADFPAEPTSAQNPSKTGIRYVSSLEEGNLAYFVEVAELPANLQKSTKQVFDDYIDGAAKGMSATVKEQHDISQAGYPGREVVMEAKGLTVHLQLILVGRKLYQVLAIAANDRLDRLQHDRFFQGFHLLK